MIHHCYLFTIFDSKLYIFYQFAFQLDEPTLGLSREFLLKGINESVVHAYYDYMVDLARMLGADQAKAKEELMKVLEFETNLANVCSTTKFLYINKFIIDLTLFLQ